MAEEPKQDEQEFDGDEGAQAYDDIPPERELIATPYEPPAKSLVEDIQNKDLIVNPDFQRRKVWDETRQSRLIESLLLNIPIPTCYFAEDSDGKKVVVDGQQRLRAIEEYVHGKYALKGLEVLSQLNEKRWVDLSERQSRIINNRTIRCIVISEKSHPDIRFEVFERLNTGVVALTDQELRNCIFRGPYNQFLHDAVEDKTWLKLVGKKQPDKRMRHEELVLRFFSLRNRLNSYKPPLKKLLSDYMKSRRNAEIDNLARYKSEFQDAIRRVDVAFGDKAFRRVKFTKSGDAHWDAAINRAVYDVQMLGLYGTKIEAVKKVSTKIKDGFEKLCRAEGEFSDAITKSTADRTKFYFRLATFNKLLTKNGVKSPLLSKL